MSLTPTLKRFFLFYEGSESSAHALGKVDVASHCLSEVLCCCLVAHIVFFGQLPEAGSFKEVLVKYLGATAVGCKALSLPVAFEVLIASSPFEGLNKATQLRQEDLIARLEEKIGIRKFHAQQYRTAESVSKLVPALAIDFDGHPETMFS